MDFDSSGGLVWVGDEKVHFMLHSVFTLIKNHFEGSFYRPFCNEMASGLSIFSLSSNLFSFGSLLWLMFTNLRHLCKWIEVNARIRLMTVVSYSKGTDGIFLFFEVSISRNSRMPQMCAFPQKWFRLHESYTNCRTFLEPLRMWAQLLKRRLSSKREERKDWK